SVERIAAVRLETGRKTLTIVVTEGAQDRPVDSVGIHRVSEIKEELPEVRIHAADDIFLGEEAKARRRGRVFPSEIAGGIPLRPRPVIDVPKILIDLGARACCRGGWADGIRGFRGLRL